MTSFHNFFLHLYPVKVPKEIVKTRTTLRLGFIAAMLYMILFVSGMYLMFFYHPAPPDAYFDMHSLSTAVAFGQFVRNVHRWSAHLMVLVVFLHLLRVFYAGAYRRPRQFNWVIGVVLLVLTLFMSFTGYLLPWDQLSYLGDHGRHEHRRVRAGLRQPGALAVARRERGERRDVAPVLRPAHLLHPRPDDVGALRSTSGGSEGRLRGRGPRRPTNPIVGEQARGAVRRCTMSTPDPEGRYRLLGSCPAMSSSARSRSPTTTCSRGHTCWCGTRSSPVRPSQWCSSWRSCSRRR